MIHAVVKQRGISWFKLSSMLRSGTGGSEVVTRKGRWKTGGRHAGQCTSVPLHAMTVERASGQVRLEGHVKLAEVESTMPGICVGMRSEDDKGNIPSRYIATIQCGNVLVLLVSRISVRDLASPRYRLAYRNTPVILFK